MSHFSSLKEQTAEDKLQTAINAGIRPIDLGDRGLISRAGIEDDIAKRLTSEQQTLIKEEVGVGWHHLERQAIVSPVFTRLRDMNNADLGEAAADFPEDVELDEIPDEYHEAQRYARMIQRGRKDGFAELDPLLRKVPKLATVSGAKVLATIRDTTDPVEKAKIIEDLDHSSLGERELDTVKWFYGINPGESAPGGGAAAAGSGKGGARRRRRTRSRRRHVRTRRSKATKGRSSKQRKSTRRIKCVQNVYNVCRR